MTTRAADPVAIALSLVQLFGGVGLLLLALGYGAAGRSLVGPVALGGAAGILLVLGFVWFRAATSETHVTQDGVERSGAAGFRYRWDELADARLQRLAGWPHLVVTPREAPTSRPLQQAWLGRRGLANDSVAAPVGLDEAAAVGQLLDARRRG